MTALRLAPIALGLLAWLVPWGGLWAVLRAASGGALAGFAGVGAGWLLALLGYSLGRGIQGLALRIFSVGLSLPLLLLSGVLWRQGQALGFFLAVAVAAALRSGYLFLHEARLSEGAPHVEAARALGAAWPRLFARHAGPSLRGSALPLALEAAASAPPLDLLLSLTGGGSGQLKAAADQARAGSPGLLLLALALAALAGVALGREASRLREGEALLLR